MPVDVDDLGLPNSLKPPAFNPNNPEHKRQIVDYLRGLGDSLAEVIEYLQENPINGGGGVTSPVVTKPGDGGFNPLAFGAAQTSGVPRDFNPGTGAPDYPYLTTPSELRVVSTSGLDAVGGAGVTEVLLWLLDANLDESFVQVTVTGSTPTAIIPGGPYLRVNAMYASATTAGDIVAAAGTISCYPDGGDTLLTSLATISAGTTLSRHGFWTVPNNREWVLRHIEVTGVDSGPGNYDADVVVLIQLAGIGAWSTRVYVPEADDISGGVSVETWLSGYNAYPAGTNFRPRLEVSKTGPTFTCLCGFETYDVTP